MDIAMYILKGFRTKIFGFGVFFFELGNVMINRNDDGNNQQNCYSKGNLNNWQIHNKFLHKLK